MVEALAAEIREAGGRALALPLDVVDADAVGPALDRVIAELGGLDILINNAGVGGEGLALDVPIEEFDRAFAVNVRGTFVQSHCAAGALGLLRVKGGGGDADQEPGPRVGAKGDRGECARAGLY
jgi:NAD(P)-dependent dehydrogenase (short-subunit alcohol dehydrogenase family)